MKLLFAAIAAFVLLLWRRWRHRAAAIDSFPYAGFLDQRLAQRRPELSEAQRAEVLAGLQDYFHLCRNAGGRMVAMPSQVVDDAWHEFILFTRHYQKFCRLAFGRFLQHTPAVSCSTPRPKPCAHPPMPATASSAPGALPVPAKASTRKTPAGCHVCSPSMRNLASPAALCTA